MAEKLPGTAIVANTITTTQLSTIVVNQISAGGGPRVSSLIYPGNDTAGNTVGGQTVYINGAGFETNNAIYINGNAVPSKSFISASNISFTTPALSAGIYPVYVINTDSGATAIFVPGYISSAEPAWATAAGSLSESQDELSAWSYSLSATGDAPITYALAAGSSLPTGVSLAANGLISGTITSPSGNTTTYTFSVVATDAQNQDSTRQFTVTTSTGEGVLFANNVLLIHADGTNNQNNHTFLDSSNNNFTITRNGNATQGTFSPFSQTGWSAFFDGTGDYLTYSPGSTLSSIGTGPLTIEAWVYYTGNHSGFHDIFVTSTSLGMLLDAGKLRFYGFSAATAATNLVQNTWVHVAVVRQSSNVFGFIGGTKVLDTTTNVGFSGSTGYIGSWTSGTTENWPGYISNLRVSNSARYTANFTPSTTQFTSDANTALLTCQSATLIDNSTNAFTITRNGDAIPRTFNPFGQTFNANIAYSTANVGGSVYLDGTGDYLIVGASNLTASSTGKTPLAVGAGDFTIEGWFNTSNVSSSAATIFKHYASPGTNDILEIRLVTNTVTVRYRVSGGVEAALTSGTITAEQWYHVAFVRNSGVVKGYLNGTEFGSASFTGNLVATTTTTTIGCDQSGTSNFTGDISNFRFVKGTAVYTSAFTPPTAPPTNIANTSLLCNFTNAGIFDQTAKNILETVGDAKVSTAQYKYGTGSVVFDGTGDYLIAPSKICDFGTGNFTVEGWIRVSNTTGAKFIADSRSTGSDAGFGLLLEDSTGYKLRVYRNGGYLITSSSTISSNTWYHVAFVRNNSNSFLYIDGTQVANSSDTNSYIQAGSFRIGAGWNNGDFFNGYIDDLRITKGYARYTSNFTAPTSAFKDK